MKDYQKYDRQSIKQSRIKEFIMNNVLTENTFKHILCANSGFILIELCQ